MQFKNIKSSAIKVLARVALAPSALAVALAATAGMAGAQNVSNYPSQPIKLVVPFAPGGSSDIVARNFGSYLQNLSKQPVVIENKGGANGIIGTQYVKAAPPDGYTLELTTNTTHAANVSLYKKLPYDAMKDFEHIAAFGTSASVALVTKESGIKSIAELVAYSKANPQKVFYCYYNSASQMSAEMFRVRTWAPITGVAYKAIGNVTSDLLGGQIQVVFMEYLPAMAQIKGDRLVPLGVTAEKRYKSWPNVPAIAESYPGYEIGFHLGLAAPAGTPPEIVNKLHGWMAQALADPTFKQKLDDLGMEALPMSRQDYIKFSAQKINHWAEYVKAAGVEPQ
ncbi:MAG: tripartite tricarboxylate transporter substrate binding protein [Herminiimonas sp.]|nr:tripartite tricarboxylate transporter substrate binding protein [Herminiimonas sp.]